MTAKLSSIGGKDSGKIYELSGEKTFIGREASNQIALNDTSVSRQHCVIQKRRNAFFLSDLKSLNGTFVGSKCADNTRLKHGDKISVGEYLFVFLEDSSDESAVNPVNIDDSIVSLPEDTVRLRLDEAIGAMARDLTALLQISTKINAVREPKELQKQLLELLFEVIPAQEGAILLLENQVEDEFSIFSLRRNEYSNEPIIISRTILHQVLKNKTAILVNDVSDHSKYVPSQSLALSQASSVLCVPLVLFEKTLGVIYLAASAHDVHFDQDYLRLLSAVAGIAAVALENARNFAFLESENKRLREENLQERNMIGESAAMQKVFKFIAKAAPTDSTVLINGESGTGKELAARAIHLNSKRRENPFVAINCAALTETLLESELFGHEKGAFTGAVTQKKGKIEVASSGTLFLDELGEMPLTLQAKLLRVLQEREYERVGGTKSLKADIRLVVATNRDLEAEVKAGRFRQDLFYRLNVVRFVMPALRERKEDIPLLIDCFVKRYADKMNRRVRGISAKAKKRLMNYDFPGNVRELENTIERAVVLGASEWILPEDLPEHFLESGETIDDEGDHAKDTYHEVVRQTKKQLIHKAFKEAKGSYVEAARLLDVHPNYLHRLIRNLNMKSELENSP